MYFLPEEYREKVLLEPISRGANQLRIVSGYATPMMASWHIAEIKERFNKAVNIDLIVGMCPLDGLSRAVHEGFKDIVSHRYERDKSTLVCKYVVEGKPVHSKVYLWEKDGEPIQAFTGSANYTQPAFLGFRRETMEECNVVEAKEYVDSLEADTMYCNHAEIEEKLIIKNTHPVLEAEESTVAAVRGAGVESITLTLLTKTGEMGSRSSLNWGQRGKREPNQAYIPLHSEDAHTGFFPLNKRQFSVITDDGFHLILRVEQQNDKAITTPLNNSQIGEYFRRRLGLANGQYVHKEDLERYGRTDVTFYKLDDEQFVMDFSV